MFVLVDYKLIQFLGGGARIHRADLQKVLLKSALTHTRLHLAIKLVSYTEHLDSVSLKFIDGSKRTCDLLVGADGLKLAVRRIFTTSLPEQESSIEHRQNTSFNPKRSGRRRRAFIKPEVKRSIPIPSRCTQCPFLLSHLLRHRGWGGQPRIYSACDSNSGFDRSVGIALCA
jgi:hypothetical protein